jgi:hypothetical protein
MAAQTQPLVVDSAEAGTVVIHRATPAEAVVCGRICFEAFASIANKHSFPPDFPPAEPSTN